MRTTIAALASALLLAGGVHASIVEDHTPITYQNDDHSGQDAADTCDAAVDEDGVRLTVDGPDPEKGEGLLVPIDDHEDHWLMPVPQDPKIDEVTVSVVVERPHPMGAAKGANVTLRVFDPACVLIGSEPVSDDGASITVPVSHGDYRATVDVETPLPAGPLQLGLVGATSTADGPDCRPDCLATGTGEHCAPGCLFGYSLAATPT